VLEMLIVRPSCRGVARRLVLPEAKRNIQVKFGGADLARFYRLLAGLERL
jgi:hypothetical protein